MKASYIPAAFVVVLVLLLGFATVPWISYPLGVVLFLVYLLLSAPDRRAARARKAGAR